jgi:hypothetical protein
MLGAIDLDRSPSTSASSARIGQVDDRARERLSLSPRPARAEVILRDQTSPPLQHPLWDFELLVSNSPSARACRSASSSRCPGRTRRAGPSLPLYLQRAAGTPSRPGWAQSQPYHDPDLGTRHFPAGLHSLRSGGKGALAHESRHFRRAIVSRLPSKSPSWVGEGPAGLRRGNLLPGLGRRLGRAKARILGALDGSWKRSSYFPSLKTNVYGCRPDGGGTGGYKRSAILRRRMRDAH